MTAISKYRLLNTGELSRIADQLESAVQDWAAGWLPESAAVHVSSALPAHETELGPTGSGWWLADCGTSATSWVGVEIRQENHPRLGGTLSAGLGGGDRDQSPHDLVAQLVCSALQDLAERAVKKLTDDGGLILIFSEGGLPLRELVKGRGAVMARLSVDDAEVRLVFSGELIDTVLGRRISEVRDDRPLVPVARGIDARTVVLRVSAGAAELRIEDLQSMGIGDVIRLNKGIDEAMDVITSTDRSVCRGYLGSRDGRRAIQIIADRV